jgi:hypothetical protein
MANVACLELSDTNVRFNEVFLNIRVDYDAVAKEKGPSSMGASEFAVHYEELLSRTEINACRVSIRAPGDVRELKFQKKLN